VNALGNFGNMYLAGMSPAEALSGYARSVRRLRGAGLQGVLRNTESNSIFKVPGMADADVYEMARQQNVIGRAAGFASEFQDPDRLTTGARLLAGRANPLSPDFAAYRALRETNQAVVEDPAKLALFVHELKQGKTVDQAALSVKKYLFDYGELSDFEKNNITGLIPFYTWTRKNVPLQLGSLALRPSRVSNQDRFVDLVDELLADEYATPDETLVPSRLKEPGTFRIGATGRGKLRLPIYDINLPGAVIDDTLQGSPDTLLGMMNPAHKTVATLGFKRNLETGEDLRYGTSKATPVATALARAGVPTDAPLIGPLTAIETPQGFVQSRLSKGAMRELPMPTVLRQLIAEAPEDATWTDLQRIILGASGLGATELTSETKTEGARELQRRYRDLYNRLRDDARLRALRAQRQNP